MRVGGATFFPCREIDLCCMSRPPMRLPSPLLNVVPRKSLVTVNGASILPSISECEVACSRGDTGERGDAPCELGCGAYICVLIASLSGPALFESWQLFPSNDWADGTVPCMFLAPMLL